MSVLKALGYVWAAPTTILSLILWFFPMWALGQMKPLRIKDGVWNWVIVPGTWWGNYYSPTPAKKMQGWIATTFGLAIMWSDSYQDIGVYRNHELRHVQQAMAFGPAWLPIYIAMEIFTGYYNDPFEVDARAHEDSGPYPVTAAQVSPEVTLDSAGNVTATRWGCRIIASAENWLKRVETVVEGVVKTAAGDVTHDVQVVVSDVKGEADKIISMVKRDEKSVVASGALCEAGVCTECDNVRAAAKDVVADVKKVEGGVVCADADAMALLSNAVGAVKKDEAAVVTEAKTVEVYVGAALTEVPIAFKKDEVAVAAEAKDIAADVKKLV